MRTWVSDRQPGERPMRVGVLVPSSNTTMEPDLASGLSGVATVHAARMPLRDVTAVAERAMIDSAPAAAATLAGLGLSCCVFGCTSAGAVLGPEGSARLIARIEDACGAPVLSVVDCVVTRLRHVDARRVGVFTPYEPDLGKAVSGHLEESGFDVTMRGDLGLRDNSRIGSLQPAEIVRAVTDRLDGCDADVVFVSCTNLCAYEVRHEIAAALGRPVVTSNSAVIDVVLDVLGHDRSVVS